MQLFYEGVRVGKGAIVAAGAIVTQDVIQLVQLLLVHLRK